jgi:hypothetical protein
VFWVISVYFNIRNTLPKSGTFLLGHPVYIPLSVNPFIHISSEPVLGAMLEDFHTWVSLIATARALILVRGYCLMRCIAVRVICTSIAGGRKATEGHVDSWYQTDVNLATTYMNGTQPRFCLVLFALFNGELCLLKVNGTDIKYY